MSFSPPYYCNSFFISIELEHPQPTRNHPTDPFDSIDNLTVAFKAVYDLQSTFREIDALQTLHKLPQRRRFVLILSA
ncbi:hypothetical protein ACE6H2_025325 [Prunus campanulata]